jgi:hypothetical protein
MDRCDAIELGVRIGRARRPPTKDEKLRIAALGVEREFLRGVRRGAKMAVRLDQVSMNFDV